MELKELRKIEMEFVEWSGVERVKLLLHSRRRCCSRWKVNKKMEQQQQKLISNLAGVDGDGSLYFLVYI